MKARNTRFLSFLALLLAVCFVLPALAEEEEFSLDIPDDLEEVVLETPLVSNPLPIDFTGGFPPQEDGYLNESTYNDPTISVEITYKDVREEYAPKYNGKKDIGVWIVDIRVGHASQLRTASAVSFNKTTSKTVKEMSERVDAVVAFNGDFAARRIEGLIIRQGTTYMDKLKGVLDVLLIDEDGDFHQFIKPKKGEVSDTIDGKKVINAFYFGPVLVDHGEIPEKFTNFKYLEPDKNYCRLAICQIGPLHYKMILTTMQETPTTTGLPLRAFAQICKDEGAQFAYNLDGGNSASLFFRGELVNSDKKEPREVPDIVYFASAWDGGDAQ